ncbi:MAG: hypothetical protein HQK99_13340 [Nitrospirae bacterium]|nr:hypothetical protein [Nitrospirota bacterium]
MRAKEDKISIRTGSDADDSRSNDVNLDRLIRWALLFTIVYFGASLLLK